jgi:DNA-binding response OmpR family regulator
MPQTKKRILFLDDDDVNRMLIRINLEHAGYEVDSAEDGEDAISQAQNQSFDLIILDLLMPAPDGFAVFQRFRELSIASRTKILILTVLGLEPQVMELMQQGAHHLKKDDAPEQLVQKVRELIG